ncbi:MAG: tripartite tricarboxylate transporter TctB family protein [Deltaproteobacteria bacterium]|nr:tripartite tricarboxylate transporter TctB family protein [Deltaproteobacteria bacterium]MBW1942218.1 tripartite tricarboxylate transporter TctB family protein [Deltaproteobacteria bacterium]
MPKYWGEILTGLVCIGLAVFFGVLALEFPAGGGTFPLFATGGTVFLALLMIGTAIFKKSPESREKVQFDWSYSTKKPYLILLVAMLHAWSIFVLGYFTSAILFLIVATFLVGLRNYKTILLTVIVLFPLMYAFFVIFLKAQLPRGILY